MTKINFDWQQKCLDDFCQTAEDIDLMNSTYGAVKAEYGSGKKYLGDGDKYIRFMEQKWKIVYHRIKRFNDTPIEKIGEENMKKTTIYGIIMLLSFMMAATCTATPIDFRGFDFKDTPWADLSSVKHIYDAGIRYSVYVCEGKVPVNNITEFTAPIYLIGNSPNYLISGFEVYQRNPSAKWSVPTMWTFREVQRTHQVTYLGSEGDSDIYCVGKKRNEFAVPSIDFKVDGLYNDLSRNSGGGFVYVPIEAFENTTTCSNVTTPAVVCALDEFGALVDPLCVDTPETTQEVCE